MTQRMMRFVNHCLAVKHAIKRHIVLGLVSIFVFGAYGSEGLAGSRDTRDVLSLSEDNTIGDVLKVRFGGTGKLTRLVIDMAQASEGRQLSDENDLKGFSLNLSHVELDHRLKGNAYGAVSDWTLEPNGSSAQLRLRFSGQAKVIRRFILPPADGVTHYRYIIDIQSQNSGDQAANTPLKIAPKAASKPLRSEVALDSFIAHRKKVIVVDAGHGGKDPGASGAESLEKNINLAAARALRDRLEATGRYRVIMTRDTDSFVDLAARVRIARGANADLFISLHSDSSSSAQTRGASIYTLSDSGTERAARKALIAGDWTRADHAPDDQMVGRILIDLTQRATKNRSASFASLLLDRLDGTTPLIQASNRQAGFAVLLAPDVPAVLLEMGYITNAQDEARLADSDQRERMMSQVTKAIDAYFDGEHTSGTLAALP